MNDCDVVSIGMTMTMKQRMKGTRKLNTQDKKKLQLGDLSHDS